MPWTKDQWKQWCQDQCDALSAGEIQQTTIAASVEEMKNYGPQTCSKKQMDTYIRQHQEQGGIDYDTAKHIVEEEGGTVLDPPDTSFLDDHEGDNDF